MKNDLYFETKGKLDTPKSLVGIGIALMLIGTLIATIVPYTIHSSYTYYNPLSRTY